jgi:predicted small lipoprotein YifL
MQTGDAVSVAGSRATAPRWSKTTLGLWLGLCCSLLTACGQKGPLALPGPGKSASAPPAVPSSVPR